MRAHAFTSAADSASSDAADATTPFERIRPDGRPPSQAEEGLSLLRSGHVGTVSSQQIGGGDAKNGRHQLLTVTDELTNRSTQAIRKSVNQGGAQEAFAHDVARAMRIDDLFVPTAWRDADRAAAIEYFPGRTLADFRITNSEQLQAAYEDMVRARAPELPAAEVTRRATVDRQLVQAFDHILANGDRHPQNIMIQRDTGELRMIDHGLINRWDAAREGLEPQLRPFYNSGAHTSKVGGVTEVALLPEVREHLAGTDRAAIRTAFRELTERTAGVASLGAQSRTIPTQFLDDVLARLESAVLTGVLRFRMM